MSRRKEHASRKSRMDQRTRERLPVLPTLARTVDEHRRQAAERLHAAQAVAPGSQFTAAGHTWCRSVTKNPAAKVWADDPDTGHRRDLTMEEHKAFWAWGDRRNAPPHRHPGRGTDRTFASQPGAIPNARHRRTHPAAAHCSVQDRRRTAAGHQPRTGRRAQHNHLPRPGHQRRGPARGLLRHPRASLESTHASAVSTTDRSGEPADSYLRHPGAAQRRLWPAPVSPTPATSR